MLLRLQYEKRSGLEKAFVGGPRRLKVAETCEKYLARGHQVYVEGRLRTREYESRNNGGKRQRTEIATSRVQFLGTPPTEAKGATAVEEPVAPADSEFPF